MKHLQPYLIFTGNCEEALHFYAECLGGEITMLMRYSESPLDIPPEHGNRVFNSAFRAGDITFMASDNLPGQTHNPGSNFSMFVTFSDSAEQLCAFDDLSDGGRVLMPLKGSFGMVQDRFDVRWMLALKGDES